MSISTHRYLTATFERTNTSSLRLNKTDCVPRSIQLKAVAGMVHDTQNGATLLLRNVSPGAAPLLALGAGKGVAGIGKGVASFAEMGKDVGVANTVASKGLFSGCVGLFGGCVGLFGGCVIGGGVSWTCERHSQSSVTRTLYIFWKFQKIQFTVVYSQYYYKINFTFEYFQ